MKAKLFCYTLGNKNSALRNRFRKELLGHNDQSHEGHYRYRKSGLLDNIWHQKPIRSVIIVKNQDASRLQAIFDKFKANYKVYSVEVKG